MPVIRGKVQVWHLEKRLSCAPSPGPQDRRNACRRYSQKVANAWSKASIITIVFVLLGLGWVVLTLQRSDFVTSANQFVEQPVQFSHQHHVGGIGIECRYCHTSVEVSPSAGIPPTKTCINCHSQIWNTSPYLEPVRASFRDDKPLNWVRVHDLPDFVYFNHSIHVRKGVGCETCHGRVDRMPLMIQKSSLQMEWCLDCHRDPVTLRAAARSDHDDGLCAGGGAGGARPAAGSRIQDRRQGTLDELLGVPPMSLDKTPDGRAKATDAPRTDRSRPARLERRRSISTASARSCSSGAPQVWRSLDEVAGHAGVPGLPAPRVPEQRVGVARSGRPPQLPEADERVDGARRRHRVHGAAAGIDRSVRAPARRRNSRQAAVLRDRDDARRRRHRACSSKATKAGRRRSKAIPIIRRARARPTCSRRARC